MKIYMIDGIGPFFLGHPKRTINWSKIPFSFLERDGRVYSPAFREIRKAFSRFVDTAASLGFNAISLDDLAHLTHHFAYPQPLRDRISSYRDEFAILFEIASSAGLQVYLTTDISFFNRTLDHELGHHDDKIISFLSDSIHTLFRDFPSVQGIIGRFGESDGLDVRGDFLSQQVLKTPRQARHYITSLLAACAAHDRTLIMRTWTIGAYPIGDLMWNPATYDAVFKGLEHPRLILSMKYGETDFFRYIPLNPRFLDDTRHNKLIELQARREYEGSGEYPSFVGGDYAQFAQALAANQTMAGAWIWGQTGGWTTSRRITFVKDSSLWNEINVGVTLMLFKEHLGVDAAVKLYCTRHLPGIPADALLELLRLSSEVVKELLYVDDYARRTIYFRRLRLPPLLHVFWDTLLITNTTRLFLRHFVHDPTGKIQQGYLALEKIVKMIQLAEAMNLPTDGLKAQYEVYKALAIAREYFFNAANPTVEKRLRDQIRAVHSSEAKSHYLFVIRLRKSRLLSSLAQRIAPLLFRHHGAYRLTDRLILIRILALLGWAMKYIPAHRLPPVAVSQGMGLRHFLK